MHAVQPHLPVRNLRESVGERGPPGSQRFHLGAGEDQPGLYDILDVIIVPRPAVPGNHRALRFPPPPRPPRPPPPLFFPPPPALRAPAPALLSPPPALRAPAPALWRRFPPRRGAAVPSRPQITTQREEGGGTAKEDPHDHGQHDDLDEVGRGQLDVVWEVLLQRVKSQRLDRDQQGGRDQPSGETGEDPLHQ